MNAPPRARRAVTIGGGIVMIGVCAFLGWGVATLTIARLRTPVLDAALASQLSADYHGSSITTAPLNASVIESIARDARIPLTSRATRFVPIFVRGVGDQLPGPLLGLPPASSKEAPPTPSPLTTTAAMLPSGTPTSAVATATPRSVATQRPAGANPTATAASNAGATATSTPVPVAGTPQPTSTSPSQGRPTATPTPSDAPIATKTPSTNDGNPQNTKTPSSNGGGTPQATHTPHGNNGGGGTGTDGRSH